MKSKSFISFFVLILAMLIISENNATASDTDAFFSAALSGDLTEVKRLIDEGVDVNAREASGATALLLALSEGNTDVAQLLIEAGVDINAQDNKGRNALGFASATGQTEIVKLLMGSGVDVNAKDRAGRTALMFASAEGTTEVVQLLIEAGADVSANDNEGRTAYMVASYFGHTEITQLLIPVGFQFGEDNSLIHINSGAVFEETIAEWVRVAPIKHDKEGKDVSVGYTYIVESYHIAATIYIYPTKAGVASADLIRSHFQEVKNTIFTQYKNAQLATEQETMFEFPSGERFGIWAVFNLELNNEKKVSYLFLFGENEWFIKFRISYPANIHGKEGILNVIGNLVFSLDYSTIH